MTTAINAFLSKLTDENKSPLTITRYRDVLRWLAQFAKGELQLDDLDPCQIDKAIVTAFVREGRDGGLRLAPATRNARLAALRSFFRFLAADGQLGRDPTAGVPYSRLPLQTPVFLTSDEFSRLCLAVERRATEHYVRRDLAILQTFWHTGLRLSELLSLDLGQVDIEAERFRQVKRKGGDVVDVHFNVEVVIAIRRWLQVRETYPRSRGEAAVFMSRRGRRLSPRSVEDGVTKYVRLAGISKHVTPHCLRHSTATELVRRGNGIEVVAEILNHKNLNTTRRYVHLVGEQVHAAVASLAEPAHKRRRAA